MNRFRARHLGVLAAWAALAPGASVAEVARSDAARRLTATPAASATSTRPAIRLHRLDSRIFGNSRTLRVLLPPGYDCGENASRRYPVLYLNDGQNLFDTATSTFSAYEWQVDETIDRLLSQGRIAPLIVVGIDNAGRRERAGEYLPYPDEFLTPPAASPQGRRYPDFLLEEVIPFVSRTYRTRPGPDGLALGGSSYGAVAALHAVLSRPGVFGRLLLESPSLYVANERLLDDARAATQWPERVYVGIGTRETGEPSGDREAVQLVRKFGEILRHAGLGEARLLVAIDEGGIHREDAWARRLGRALEFLYGP